MVNKDEYNRRSCMPRRLLEQQMRLDVGPIFLTRPNPISAVAEHLDGYRKL